MIYMFEGEQGTRTWRHDAQRRHDKGNTEMKDGGLKQ